jgi:hypothetical protein
MNDETAHLPDTHQADVSAGGPVAPGARIVFSESLSGAAQQCRAEAVAQADQLHVDAHVVAPPAAWAVADIEALMWPVRYAGDGAVSVAVGLDRASPAIWDRLLRTLEEPDTTWWVWIAVNDPSALPDSLRGRALSELPAEESDPVQFLHSTGWGEQASDLAAALGGRVICVGPVAAPDTEAGLVAYQHLAAAATGEGTSPEELAGACERIAKLFSEPARGREALRWVAESQMVALRPQLRAFALSGNRAAFRDATLQLDRARHTMSLLDRHTSTATAAWALSVGCEYEP